MEGIDDILAEVSNDRGPGGHSRRAGDGGDDDGYAYDRSLAPETRDLQALTRAWMAERAAPELRPYPHTLMERVMGRIRRQVCFPFPLFSFLFLLSFDLFLFLSFLSF
jgi:hypothetical protein